jgi:hypothetical protein
MKPPSRGIRKKYPRYQYTGVRPTGPTTIALAGFPILGRPSRVAGRVRLALGLKPQSGEARVAKLEAMAGGVLVRLVARWKERVRALPVAGNSRPALSERLMWQPRLALARATAAAGPSRKRPTMFHAPPAPQNHVSGNTRLCHLCEGWHGTSPGAQPAP